MEPELDLFGWDLLYSINEKFLNDKIDVAVCFVHWILVRRGFRCGGVGDDTTMPRPNQLSELLPAGWNTGLPYRLRYVYDRKLYLLSCIKDDDELLINISRPADNQLGGMRLRIDDIQATRGNIATMIPRYAHVAREMNETVIDEMLVVTSSKDAGTQTEEGNKTFPAYHPLPAENREIPLPAEPPFPFVGNVGIADLHPLLPGHGQGGMLFQGPGIGPRAPMMPDPGMPLGSLPPGARYDPIRPPHLGRPRPSSSRPPHPDHDHLPPPGFDDMFM